MGVSWEKKSAKRAGRATMIVESLNITPGTSWYRRRFPRGGGGGDDAVYAFLFGLIEPASYTLDLTATTDAAAAIVPSDPSDDPVVLPLTFDEESGRFKAVVWPEGSEEGEPGEPKKLRAENHCWETCIVGGDGLEIGTSDVYNERPLLVKGIEFQRTVGEGELAVTFTCFAVTEVVTELAMFIATADADVSGADFDATPTEGIRGKLPQGTKEIQNPLTWDLDEGGAAIIVQGFDTAGVKYWAFNAECPT